MSCKKCGKQLQPGEAYCSGCGQKVDAAPGKNNGGCLILLLIVAAIIFLANRNGKTEKKTVEPVTPATTAVSQYIDLGEYGQPLEPFHGDILTDSDYRSGTPRRRVENHGDNVYVTDYREDGTMLRETILYYSDGIFSARRVTNNDSYGIRTDVTERLADGTLWLYLYYKNTYTDDGRPFDLVEYNRTGHMLYESVYFYYEDGSYTINFSDYRGPVYEYDFETNPSGETYLFSYGYTKYDANGNFVEYWEEETDHN